MVYLKKISATNKSKISPLSFPSNPKTGDVYTASPIEIRFDTVITGAAGIAGLLTCSGIGAGAALVLTG